MMKSISILCFLNLSLFFSVHSFAQDIRYLETPENLQLYARDNTDSASVLVHGEISADIRYDKIELKVFKDNELFNVVESKLDKKHFRTETKIDAGLHLFRFEMHFKKGNTESVEIIADSVVCGDAYIVTGQSNSHASSSLCTFSSPYCRSFGVKTGYESYNDEDKQVRWGMASGNCPDLKGVGGWFKKNPYGVGIWGMELARLIVEKHKIPVCVINGGSGSSSIEENMLYPEKPSLETSFGRLAYRVNQAGLKNNIKAIFWHQGETNSDERYKIYASQFDILYTDWKRVYTGLEKIYMFQLHPGCGGEFQSEMREIQHQNSLRYKDVEIMSTTGVIGHDGCHFLTEGYYEFAQRILPLVSRDFYCEELSSIITPPKLLNAYYQSAKEIVLELDQAIVLEEKHKEKGKEFLMKDQFFFRMNNNDEVKANVVENIQVLKEKIILNLSSETIYDNITWLPNKNYVGTKICYNGPWIKGAENNLGALSFHRKTIDKPLQKETPNWRGFTLLDSTLNGTPFKVVSPKKTNKNRNWIWRARFWGHEPQTDIALLEKGFHLVYINVGGLFGSPKAINIWDDFYEFATKKYQLSEKVVLEGMSRGGLIIFNWGNANAEKVACIYGDAPVCDFKSWPGGIYTGKGSKSDWKICKEQYGFSEKIALQFNGNPIDHLENIARLKVPILNVVGDADKVVPVSENTALLEKRINELGWKMEVIHKPGVGHHPHSLKDPLPIVDFILKHTGNK